MIAKICFAAVWLTDAVAHERQQRGERRRAHAKAREMSAPAS